MWKYTDIDISAEGCKCVSRGWGGGEKTSHGLHLHCEANGTVWLEIKGMISEVRDLKTSVENIVGEELARPVSSCLTVGANCLRTRKHTHILTKQRLY